MIKILFTSIGRRVELIQEFRKAAQVQNTEVCLVGTDLSDDAPALYYCDLQYQTPAIKDKQYIPNLISICQGEKIDLLIPTIDTDLLVLSQSIESFKKIGTRVLISNEESIRICRDKRLVSGFFESIGIKTPKPVDDINDYTLGYPCFIKPKDGSSSQFAFKVNNRSELEGYVQNVPDYIIQPYIQGKEYTIDILCDFNGNPITLTVRERLAVRSGEVLKTQIIEDKGIEKECLTIIEKFRPCGPITVQLIKERRTGINYYIEINPRFGGGAPLSIKAGANSAAALLLLLKNKEIKYGDYPAIVGKTYSRFDQSIEITKRKGIIEIDNILSVQNFTDKASFFIFDLDDTLYGEKDYVRSGFKAIEKHLQNNCNVFEILWEAFTQNKKPIDQLVKQLGIEEQKQELLNIYRSHQPDINFYPGVDEMLSYLRGKGKKIGVITDGRPNGQRAKINSLCLDAYVDEIIITDELAGNGDVRWVRKPNKISFDLMKMRFNANVNEMIYIGDNYRKDVIAAKSAGLRCLHFNNCDGLYSK